MGKKYNGKREEGRAGGARERRVPKEGSKKSQKMGPKRVPLSLPGREGEGGTQRTHSKHRENRTR